MSMVSGVSSQMGVRCQCSGVRILAYDCWSVSLVDSLIGRMVK